MSDLHFDRPGRLALRTPDLSGAILSRLDDQQMFLSRRRRAWARVARVTGLALASSAAIGVAAIQSQRWTAALREEQARALGPLVRSATQRAAEGLARVAEIGTPGESWVVASIPAVLPADAATSVGSAIEAPSGAASASRPALWTWEPAVRAAAQIPQSAAASSVVDGYLRRRDRGGAASTAGGEWAASPALRFIRVLSLADTRDPFGTGSVKTVAWPASSAVQAENPR